MIKTIEKGYYKYLVASIFSILLYIYSQLFKNYTLSLLSISLYSIFFCISVMLKNSRTIIIVALLYGTALWLIYYAVLGPNWIMANGDLLYMYKVSERTFATGRYPFDDQILLSFRPNYVEYPTPFILQTILSMITSIDTLTLMYIPIVMYSSFILITVLTVLLMKRCSRELLPLATIPILSFMSPYPKYFIYPQVKITSFLIAVYDICEIL